MKGRIAIIGGGIAGVTAVWQVARLGANEVTLFEASSRLGGTVETVRRDGLVVDCGPDGWVSDKPWAEELARELGLGDELIGSKDDGRVTYIVQGGKLLAMPDGMRMMVPTDMSTLHGSPLFSAEALTAYAAEPGRADELKATAPAADESVAEFVRRHFGDEVLNKVGGPLLSGVFGGDVAKLSVRAVMPRFVEMEREHGSLIQALQSRTGGSSKPVFTSLKSGVGALVERMVAEIPARWVRVSTVVSSIKRMDGAWRVTALGNGRPDSKEFFDAVLLAVPAHVAQRLLRPVNGRMGELLTMETSSAVLAALAFDEDFELPRGFGFLAPQGEGCSLLAGTFVDQKFPDRVPQGSRLLRGFFGGETAAAMATKSDAEISARVLTELEAVLGPLPKPKFSVVRRWPRSLPQYEVGHLERMDELSKLAAAMPGLKLLGNAYRGVGLPDLIRDSRAAARELA
jgi:oxygen-dependent protoporphyrinogen oxidase